MATMSLLLCAVLFNLLCVCVFTGVPLTKRSGFQFNNINHDRILLEGNRVKRQVSENLNEASESSEKQPTKVSQPNDEYTGSLTTNAPEVSSFITKPDVAVPKTEADPDITKSGLNSDQALDLVHSTMRKETGSTSKPTSPEPIQSDRDVSQTETADISTTLSEINKKTTSGLINPDSEDSITPELKPELTTSVNEPTSEPGVNPLSNITTQSVTATIPPQSVTSKEFPKVGELKMTEMSTDKSPTTAPTDDDIKANVNNTTTNIGLVPLSEEKSASTTLIPKTETTGSDNGTELSVLVTSTPKSDESGVNLAAPPPPSDNTTMETDVPVANSSIITTTTIPVKINVSITTESVSTVMIPVELEVSNNTSSAPQEMKSNETKMPDTLDQNTTNATTTVLTESSPNLVNETTETTALESGLDSNLTTVVQDVSNMPAKTTPIAINDTIYQAMTEVAVNNDTTENVYFNNATQSMSTMVDDIGTNLTEESTTPVIFLNATDFNTTTNPVVNVTDTDPETSLGWINRTDSYNFTSTENVTYSTLFNATVSSDTTDVNMGVDNVTATVTDVMNTTNVTSAALTKATAVVPVNLTMVHAVPTQATTQLSNTTTPTPNTTTIPSTSVLPDTSMTMNASVAIGQSQGLSASALTAIITGSIIGFWIILGPIICLVCKVRDRRKERYHMRLGSMSDPTPDNGMVDAMIISELKKNSETSHDNSKAKEKDYNTVLKDESETERLQPKTAEHEF